MAVSTAAFEQVAALQVTNSATGSKLKRLGMYLHPPLFIAFHLLTNSLGVGALGGSKQPDSSFSQGIRTVPASSKILGCPGRMSQPPMQPN
jgi:hypothetical protein